MSELKFVCASNQKDAAALICRSNYRGHEFLVEGVRPNGERVLINSVWHIPNKGYLVTIPSGLRPKATTVTGAIKWAFAPMSSFERFEYYEPDTARAIGMPVPTDAVRQDMMAAFRGLRTADDDFVVWGPTAHRWLCDNLPIYTDINDWINFTWCKVRFRWDIQRWVITG